MLPSPRKERGRARGRLRFFGFIAATVFAALFLAACGGGSSSNNSTGTGTSGATGSSGAGLASAAPTPTTAAPSCTGPNIASIQRTGKRSFPAAPDRIIDPTKHYVAQMQTSRGVITIDLDAADAPNTVNNFVFLSCNGFYDGLTFHRVVKSPQPFVVQGGDPRGDGTGGPGYLFANETSPNINHDAAGVISMARTSQPDTNGSQFFITLAPQPSLDGQYNAFGHVTAGMDVVNNIAQGDLILAVSITES
ncbi:MAG TPA: peptidylprolyl isomerase [Dehalococcoidia bacterium]|nr:peptidylprolyl isomerase [Dehalococcoidia bacterium]